MRMVWERGSLDIAVFNCLCTTYSYYGYMYKCAQVVYAHRTANLPLFNGAFSIGNYSKEAEKSVLFW